MDRDTRLDLAKRGIIGYKLICRAYGRPLKNLKCCFIFLINILKSLVVLAKIMPIANVNRIVFVN